MNMQPTYVILKADPNPDYSPPDTTNTRSLIMKTIIEHAVTLLYGQHHNSEYTVIEIMEEMRRKGYSTSLNANKEVWSAWAQDDPINPDDDPTVKGHAYNKDPKIALCKAIVQALGCKHETGTVTNVRTYPATHLEPAETTGTVTCDKCGEIWELGYEPCESLRNENGGVW